MAPPFAPQRVALIRCQDEGAANQTHFLTNALRRGLFWHIITGVIFEMGNDSHRNMSTHRNN